VSIPKLEEGLAFAAVGTAVLETFKIYQDNAPSLREVRAAPPGDFQTRQLILDADILGMIVVVVMGGAGSLLIRRWYPLLLASLTLVLISAYYRSVCNSENEGVTDD
jgi:hypothetical protein